MIYTTDFIDISYCLVYTLFGDNMINITQIRHAWPENGGFVTDRKNGHENYTFMHFFGSIDIAVKGKLIRTKPHACIIYNIGEPQFYKSDVRFVHDWMHLSGDFDRLLKECGLETERLYYPQNPIFITDIVKEMEREYFFAKSNKELLLQTKTQELFIKLSRACFEQTDENIGGDTAERFQNLREQMFANLSYQWSTEQMAELVSLSKSRFYSVYKSIYGNSPTDDLIRARIDYAKNALISGGETVSQISERLGYNNTTHFIRQFKAFTGYSPSQYRKSQRQ